MSFVQCGDAQLLYSIVSEAYAHHNPNADILQQWTQSVDTIATELSEGMQAWVLYVDEQAVGAVKTRLQADVFHFWHLSVLPSFQGRGFGVEMLAHLEQLARTHRCAHIECSVHFLLPSQVNIYLDRMYEVVSKSVVIKSQGYQEQWVVLRKSLLKP